MIDKLIKVDPIVEGAEWVALKPVYDIIIKEQLLTRTKGFETLTFKIPMTVNNVPFIKSEHIVELDNRRYIIRRITKSKKSERIVTVECDALWYELADGEPRDHLNPSRLTAQQAIEEQLAGTGWTVGTVDITEVHAFTIHDFVSPLYILRYIQRLFNGEMYFDTRNRTVNLVQRIGTDTTEVVSYNRNSKGITRIDDTTELNTRVYMYGRNGVTIAEINDGKDYIEDFSWYDEQGLPRVVKAHTIKDERFTELDSMLSYMQSRLDAYKAPRISYELEEFVLKDNLELGDSIIISDADFGLNDRHRVIERKINVLFPSESIYVLDFAIEDLSSLEDDTDYIIPADEAVEDVNADLQEHIANQIRHVTADERQTWEDAYITANTTASNLVTHANNTTIHITAAERTQWNGYNTTIATLQQQLSTAQSNITALQTAQQQLANRVTALETDNTENRSNITDLQETAQDLDERVTALEQV